MPLADYLSYSAGFMPKHDAAAQTRCYKYLELAIRTLDERIETENSQQLRNLRTIFEDIRSVVDVASGSVRIGRANTFWKYWDKNKRRIISVQERTDDEYVIQDKYGELEEGRYIPDEK